MYETRSNIPTFDYRPQMQNCGPRTKPDSMRSQLKALKPGDTLLIPIGQRVANTLAAQVSREMRILGLEIGVRFHQRKLRLDAKRYIGVQIIAESELI